MRFLCKISRNLGRFFLYLYGESILEPGFVVDVLHKALNNRLRCFVNCNRLYQLLTAWPLRKPYFMLVAVKEFNVIVANTGCTLTLAFAVLSAKKWHGSGMYCTS